MSKEGVASMDVCQAIPGDVVRFTAMSKRLAAIRSRLNESVFILGEYFVEFDELVAAEFQTSKSDFVLESGLITKIKIMDFLLRDGTTLTIIQLKGCKVMVIKHLKGGEEEFRQKYPA